MNAILQNLPLDLSLWGNRSYVHSSHVLLALLELLDQLRTKGDPYPLSLNAQFREPLKSQAECLIFANKESRRQIQDTLQATIDLSWPDEILVVGLSGTGEAITKHVPDDEAALLQHADLAPGEQQGVIRRLEPQRLFAGLTILAKALHKKRFQEAGYGPWAAARIDLRCPAPIPPGEQEIFLRMDKVMGAKMTCSYFRTSGGLEGTLYFNRMAMQ